VSAAVREILADEGWRVDGCEDGLTALSRLESATHYDLIILDHELPRMTGSDLAACARQLPHRRETPIIVVSARDVRGIARAAGATLFLHKPEDMRNLAGVVKRLTDI
jgi:two-component system chemotaxis response regulator CheY